MDDASERAIEEDMLDQFNYFDDEDEELIDRREPASLDAFDLVGEEPDEDEVESAEPPTVFAPGLAAFESPYAPRRSCRRTPYEN